MPGTTSKIILAVGLTALLTAIVLIAAFGGYLYLCCDQQTADVPVRQPDPVTSQETPGQRAKGPVAVSADEITEVELERSSMATTSSATPTTFFGNINIHNYVSKNVKLTFNSDGAATKSEAGGHTADGVKTSSAAAYSANIGRDDFTRLARVLVENDFANEPDSANITSLPSSVILTVKYGGKEKRIKASNMGNDTPEMTTMLKAIDELDKKVNWTASR